MKKTKNTGTVLLILVFFLGLSLLLYPTVANKWNEYRTKRFQDAYEELISGMEEADYQAIWDDAYAYNAALKENDKGYMLDRDMLRWYETTLHVEGSKYMGYIDVPGINLTLSVSHTTSAQVLQTGVGHLEWTPLPTGESGIHVALSGHRGLPSARLFTNLDKLVEGDIFRLRILDRTFVYEVDQILIVEPDDMEALFCTDENSYCTLVTCTPYGINTHRLLVRGHRVEYIGESDLKRITADAIQVEPLIATAFLGIPLLILILLISLLFGGNAGRGKKKGTKRDLKVS